MRPVSLAVIAIAITLSVSFAAFGPAPGVNQLGSREAREKIAGTLGLEKSDKVHIKYLSDTIRGNAIVEATIETAFHFTTDKSGDWTVSEIRTREGVWESIELIQTAVKKEKALRTTADLRFFAIAIDAYKREHGTYITAKTCRELCDILVPRYMKNVIILDPWSREFQYQGSPEKYRLFSVGADGKRDTDDDIIIENSRMIRGPQGDAEIK